MSWVILAPSAGAGSFDLEIHCTPKKIDQQNDKGSDGGANRTKEHWVYEVTVENKTFKDLTNLEVKYSTFFTQEQLGVKLESQRVPVEVLVIDRADHPTPD